jgi:DNA segregation ATPase FtsK/SpoIIIE, S-DNA-T family
MNTTEDGEFKDLIRTGAELFVKEQRVGTSLLTRRLGVVYNEAVKIVDELERLGIIGPFRGAKSRKLLVKTVKDLDRVLSKNN